MKIAIAGLANSHPFTDAQHLRELHGDVEFVVADPDEERRAKFLEQEPSARVVESMAALAGEAPDAAVVTVQPQQVNALVEAFLDAAVPTYVCKPAAVTRQQLVELDALVEGREHLFLTASVLRFASAMAGVPTDAVIAHVVADHPIDYWVRPESRWQDDPDAGGGLVPVMGVHAFELLEAVLGPTMRVTACLASKVSDLDLTSPDVAAGSAVNDAGALATFEINGMAEEQRYVVELTTDDGSRDIPLGGGVDPYGFHTVARTIAAMAGGAPSPLPWVRSRAVLQAVVDARRLAASALSEG